LSALAAELPRAAINAKSIALISTTAVALGVFLSGFVINEPAPYELYMAGLIAVWALFGLRISRYVAPLAVLLVSFNIGGMISMTQMESLMNTPLYLAVSLFLAFTAIFIAAVVEARPELYRVIFLAWIAAAVSTALLGILGYFDAFPGASVFTRYDRATGAFEDPNVFGPFLTLPGIYLLYRLMTGRPIMMLAYAVPLLVVAGGIFLSFSRGAWGLFGISAILLVGCLFLQSASGLFRLRVVVMTVAALVLLALAALVVLQIPAVSEMFSARAQLAQDYDSDRLGRFARYGIGFLLAMEHPLGIGPLVFGQIYREDTHNIWLKALLDYGWLGFAAWAIMIGWTIAGGFRILFRARPWQPFFLCVYIVFLGHVALGSIIDTDHWRHFYLLLGMVWGGMALEHRHQREIAVRTSPGFAPLQRLEQSPVAEQQTPSR
jgi:O-antigen ligase